MGTSSELLFWSTNTVPTLQLCALVNKLSGSIRLLLSGDVVDVWLNKRRLVGYVVDTETSAATTGTGLGC